MWRLGRGSHFAGSDKDKMIMMIRDDGHCFDDGKRYDDGDGSTTPLP